MISENIIEYLETVGVILTESQKKSLSKKIFFETKFIIRVFKEELIKNFSVDEKFNVISFFHIKSKIRYYYSVFLKNNSPKGPRLDS